MSEGEFLRRMAEIDKELAAKGKSILARCWLAAFEFGWKEKIVFPHKPRDPAIGQYEGVNLLWAIEDWYMKHYGPQLMVGNFGKRLMIIRAHVYEVNVPAIFNPRQEIPAFDHIVDFEKPLAGLITGSERQEIQARFNRMFNEGSRLAFLSISLQRLNGHNVALAGEYLTRGLTDLHAAVSSYIRSDPGANLFSAQQAVEKFLKAYLTLQDASLDDSALRSAFGHSIKKLLNEAAKREVAFAQIQPHITKMNITPASRYHPKKLMAAEAVAVIDLAYAICDFVAQVLLPSTRTHSV